MLCQSASILALLIHIYVNVHELASVFGTWMEMCRDGGGGMRRWRQESVETENAGRYYFILTTSTIYSKLVLIVKE
jgi:hypothetical protein